MFVLDADLAKHNFEERLHQAEYDHMVDQMRASKPKLHVRLMQYLGDRLIACGASLKAQPQQKFV